LQVLAARGMASNRNSMVEGASNETNITEEVRDLIRNMKSADNMEEWQVDPTLGQKITVKTFRPNRSEDIDNDQEEDMVYWPHAGEEKEWAAADSSEPPLVLLVEMTDTSSGQPYWFKEALEQLGLLTGGFKGKRVAVPNMTHYTSLIYKVKHLVRVTPVTFPNGVPSVNDFDPSMARVTDNGDFLYHPKIKANFDEVEAGLEASEKMLIQERTYKKKAGIDWRFSRDSPLGNSNYHRNTGIIDPKRSNRVTDSIHKIRY